MVNIRSQKNKKIANICDYCDDETVENITNLLLKFQDLFLSIFSKMKGIVGDLGEMKIPLRPNANIVKQQ